MLERFTGYGTLILAGAGNFIDINPAKYGGKIQVHTGCLVAFEDTVTYGVKGNYWVTHQWAVTAQLDRNDNQDMGYKVGFNYRF